LGDINGKKVVCIAGKGNNGGGVIASLRYLDYHGAKTILVLSYPKIVITEPSRVHLRLIPKGTKVITYGSRNLSKIMDTIKKADVVIDGIFGTGFSGSIDEPIYSIIEAVNKSRGYAISNDIPSGIEAGTGIESGISVHADFVMVLHKRKRWMVISEFPNYSVESIGIPQILSG
jgi:NAD(P)H-hydrate epimerase